MKKFLSAVLMVILLFTLVGCGIAQSSGFVTEDSYFSAQANDDKLALTLQKKSAEEEWIAESKSEFFTVDHSEEKDDSVVLHFVAVKKGTGTMVLKHVTSDGAEEAYHLTLEVSRPQLNRLAFSSLRMVKAD